MVYQFKLISLDDWLKNHLADLEAWYMNYRPAHRHCELDAKSLQSQSWMDKVACITSPPYVSRPQQLLKEAQSRNPQWQVKRLSTPLEE